MALVVINHDSIEDLFERAARDFLSRFDETLTKKPFFDVALLGGTTANAFFTFLINQLIGHANLSRVRFFFSDERVVEIDSTDSNAGNAKRLLLSPLGIDDTQIFPMYDGKCHPEACAKDYENLVKTLVPIDAQDVPIFDLIYLGIGQDGHTASLFPHNEILEDAHRLVRATKESGFPYDRITMMPRLIIAATQIYVLAYGPQKAAVINEIVNGPLLPHSLPAQLILRNEASNAILLTADLAGADS